MPASREAVVTRPAPFPQLTEAEQPAPSRNCPTFPQGAAQVHGTCQPVLGGVERQIDQADGRAERRQLLRGRPGLAARA
ncbi:MAG: hypothetical protein AB1446_04785 [Bacillota bacterium]